jgi:hypothetical protein
MFQCLMAAVVRP